MVTLLNSRTRPLDLQRDPAMWSQWHAGRSKGKLFPEGALLLATAGTGESVRTAEVYPLFPQRILLRTFLIDMLTEAGSSRNLRTLHPCGKQLESKAATAN